MTKKIVCPACGVNREALKEMLQESPVLEDNGYGWKVLVESENHATARLIISNCKSCLQYFEESKIRHA